MIYKNYKLWNDTLKAFNDDDALFKYIKLYRNINVNSIDDIYENIDLNIKKYKYICLNKNIDNEYYNSIYNDKKITDSEEVIRCKNQFNCDIYRSCNGDLSKFDNYQLISHFISYGQYELRQFTNYYNFKCI